MLSAVQSQKLMQVIQRSVSTNVRSVVYAQAQALADDTEVSHTPVQITTLPNGISVASCDHAGPITKVAIGVRGGSRFESPASTGVSHYMKNAAFITNNEKTDLRTTREMEIIGGATESSSSRELITRKGLALRSSLAELLGNIAPSVVAPLYNSWDIKQTPLAKQWKEQQHVVYQVEDACAGDVAMLNCAGKNIELLHETAFHSSGLGNSVLCPQLMLGSVKSEDLSAYASEIHVGSRITVVGSNCDHGELVQLTKELLGDLPAGSAPTPATPQYYGGEARLCTRKGLTFASLVGPGASVGSDDAVTLAVLQNILYQPSSVKWGSNTVSSRINSAVGAVTDVEFQVSALNLSYSDTGLFGVHVVAPPTAITDILKAACDESLNIANGGITASEVEAAKAQLATSALAASADSDGHLDDLLNQVALTGSYTSSTDVLAKIEAVTVEAVVDAAHKCFNATSTLVVTGDTAGAPYLSEL